MLRIDQLFRPASHEASRQRTGASLPETLAPPRTGLSPVGSPQLVAWLRHDHLLLLMTPRLLDALQRMSALTDQKGPRSRWLSDYSPCWPLPYDLGKIRTCLGSWSSARTVTTAGRESRITSRREMSAEMRSLGKRLTISSAARSFELCFVVSNDGSGAMRLRQKGLIGSR